MLLVCLAGGAAVGCDSGPVQPGSEGCTFAESLVSECTIAVLEISGGLTAADDAYVIRDDGTVRHIDRRTGAAQERAVPGGLERAARLADELAATHVRDAESGCYLADEEVPESLSVRVTLHEDGHLSFYGSDCGSGPDALLEAIGLLEDYVQEAI